MTTAVKERPILFSAPMVRAILEGRKSQTRRLIKPQPSEYADSLHGGELRRRAPYDLECEETGCIFGFGFFDEDQPVKCPYGRPGDRLWCREAWGHPDDDLAHVPYDEETGSASHVVLYRADDAVLWCYEDGGLQVPAGGVWLADKIKWRPSIHMPRWASRITLEVTDVRVERLQEITEEDAIAEGSQCAGVPASLTNRGAFAKLWESINGPGSWDANPWVWAISFK